MQRQMLRVNGPLIMDTWIDRLRKIIRFMIAIGFALASSLCNEECPKECNKVAVKPVQIRLI